jgi:two-component system sensor kinase FixL
VNALSFVTIAWSMIAAAASLLGLLHFARWAMDPTARADLTFSIVALAFVGVAISEIGMMQAGSPEDWGLWVQWCHLPLAILIIATVIFVRQYLGTGRAWLAAVIIALRLVILAINFGSDPNFNFDRIDTIDRIPFFGEFVTVVGESTTGRWQLLGTIASLLLAVFVLDAAISLWRRGGADYRRRAVLIGGGVFLFVTVAGVYVQTVLWGVAQLPLLITPCFLLTLLAMAFELSRDSLRASRLARDFDQGRLRLELAADAADVGLCEWDPKSGQVWATLRAREIFGLTPEEAGKPENWLSRVHPDDAPRVMEALKAALERGEELVSDYRVCPPGRGERWVAARGRAEHTPGDVRARLRGVVRDVSEQHAAQLETQELRRELAHVGRVSVLGQLASSLAHELSQPLGAILRNTEAAELILREPAPDLEELRAIIGDIHRDDQRAGDVINRLRQLLKRRRMDFQPVALEGLVNDVESLMHADAASRHVNLIWSVEPGLPPISGDRVHLSQVLINLIINAMDAVADMAQPDRRVAIHARRDAEGDVELTVRDSGTGIPAGNLDRIFDPFFTTKANGMGMGLSVCCTIVDAHGGTLKAANDPAGGAIFMVRLRTAATGSA